MIDAAVSFEDEATGLASPAQRQRHVRYKVAAVTSAGTLASYEALCAKAVFAPAQSALWVRSWISEVGPEGLIAEIEIDGRPVFALALEIVKAGPFRVARFMGGSHANGNFPAALPSWLDQATGPDMRGLVEAIRSTALGIDALVLQRVAADLDGRSNPLLALPHAQSPNIALSLKLEGGFNAVLDRTSAKRKRKKHRAQTRKFEAAGGFRRTTARTSDETRRLLDAFLVMKEQRFNAMGVANVFADAKIRAFFHSLFARALDADAPAFTLEGLEVGGKLRAVTGSSRCGSRLICEFGAICEDELAGSSPGEFLFYKNISDACENGFEIYDFSVGDEQYKRLWCDIETRHVDIVVPLSSKGRLYTAGARLIARLKSVVKNNPAIWKFAKRLRKRAASQTAPAED